MGEDDRLALHFALEAGETTATVATFVDFINGNESWTVYAVCEWNSSHGSGGMTLQSIHEYLDALEEGVLGMVEMPALPSVVNFRGMN